MVDVLLTDLFQSTLEIINSQGPFLIWPNVKQTSFTL